MLLEPGGSDLAPGLLLSPSLVTVDNGVAYVPVVNLRYHFLMRPQSVKHIGEYPYSGRQ